MQFIVFPTDLRHRWLSDKVKGKASPRRNSEERIWLAKYPSGNARLVRGIPLIPRKNERIQGGRVIAKRTRPFAYTFRVSEQEKNLIDDKLAKSGLTMRDFILRSITDKPIIVIERGGEILAELKRQGNNLNQAVRSSYFGADTEREIKNCIAYLKELYRKISFAAGG